MFLLWSFLAAQSLILLQAKQTTNNIFACDHSDLIQLSYMPGLGQETPFTKTRLSKAGKHYCKSIFLKDCLNWCAYDKRCVSVHFLSLSDPNQCVCHKCYLLYEELPSPQRIAYGSGCSTLGYTAGACISLACRQKIDQRKIDHAGIQYEEIPLLNTRAWMSSVLHESLSQYGPQMAVDDDVNTFASHEKKYSAVDAGYHWIIIELPYQALVTHVTVRSISPTLLRDMKRKDFDRINYSNKTKVSTVYLLDWQILSVSDSVVCQDYAKSDLYLIGTLTMIVGRYFNKGFMCIVGKSVDPMTFRSSEKSKKLQAVITEKTTSCKLWYNHKPWKNLTSCQAMFLSKSYSDFGLKGLEGAELLAAADMTSTPDSLFTSASGRRYQFKLANKKVDWYNKLISWKYWTVCGRFSNLLTRTTIGMEEIMLNQACRSQHALFLAIRSTKPLKIFDIQAYRRVSQKPVGGIPPAYLSFACPTSQYGGFTPEFVSANLRPYKLDMSQMGRFYDLLNISVTKLLDVNRACYLPDLRQNPYMEITNRACNYTRETIRVTQLSYRKSITKVVQNFVKSSMEPDIPDYILNVLANLAEDFLKSWGGEVTVRRDPIQFKLNWTSYMMTQFHPKDQLKASLLHYFRHNIYSRRVPTDSKLRSDLFYNGHICFISCHWAHRLSSLANKFNASDEIVPLMFNWFLEAFCPDPCANARCKRVKNSENGQCTISQSGLWADSYECACKAGHYWSRSTHDCVPQLLCNRPRDSSEYPCSPRYTLYCESRVTKVGKNGTEAEAETETICVCKEGYGGSRCERLADPCTDRHPFYSVSGNFACATYDGLGTCRRSKTSNSIPNWECVCSFQRARDLALVYDNCAAYRNVCLSMNCINGYFISSKIGNLCRCKCNPGYSGSTCAQWTGVWSPWSQWDRCRPECGNADGNRRSISLRSCINKRVLGNATPHDFCVGEAQRWTNCDPAACWLGGDQPVSKSFRLRGHFLLSSATLACVLAAVSVGATFLFCRYRGYNIGPRPPFESVYQQG